MKLNKKALVTLIGGTALLSLALVGCNKTEKTPVTEPVEQTAPEETADKTVEGDEATTENNEDVVAEDGLEVIEVDAVTTRSSDLYEKLINGLELPASMQLDENLLADAYGLKAEDVASNYVAIPVVNVHATEIGVFEVKDGNVDAIQTAIDKRQADLEKTWETYLPDQLELVKNSKVVTKGDFMLYVISSNADDIVAKFESIASGVAE